jgi:hypothetical protein
MNLKKSLKPIQKKLSKMHHAYATIRQVFPHLHVLENQEILDYYNVKNVEALEEHIAYMKRIIKQKENHFQETLDEMKGCFCQDAKGEFKYLYPTKKEAERQVTYSLKSRGVKLKCYPCPYHCGWHVSRLG